MIGRSLGHYRITAAIGAGGMGEVYRATDTKLGRDVAIKMLPAAVAQDPERLARFEREARSLASLKEGGGPRCGSPQRSRSSTTRGGRRLSPADELHDLEDVAISERGSAVFGLGQDFAIPLDGHAGRRDAQAREQVGDRGAGGQAHGLAVDGDGEFSAHFFLMEY